MKQVTAIVVSNSEIMPRIHLVWLEAPEIARIARPGQFVMVRCGDSHDPLLRRPLSIHQTDGSGKIALLLSVVGRGTSWLSRCQRGDCLDLVGPLGNGFSIQPASRRLLLIGGGVGIAPLIFLADRALSQGCSVTLLVGAQDASSLYPRYLLSPSINLITATEDGSEGARGMVTDIIGDLARQTDQLFACGPVSMYQSMLANECLISRPLQVSLEMVMGCGVGACYGCTIKTGNGLRQVCQDGPVFDLNDILW